MNQTLYAALFSYSEMAWRSLIDTQYKRQQMGGRLLREIVGRLERHAYNQSNMTDDEKQLKFFGYSAVGPSAHEFMRPYSLSMTRLS
jgi:hypothetical protein